MYIYTNRRVAMLICFDINFTELWQHLAARSVDLVFWPSMYPAGQLVAALARVCMSESMIKVCVKHQ